MLLVIDLLPHPSHSATFATAVIDLGGATYENDSHASAVTTHHYRAPEVILGMHWLYLSDLWSIACIIAKLFLGHFLFATVRDLSSLVAQYVTLIWI